MEEGLSEYPQLSSLRVGNFFTLPKPTLAISSGFITNGGAIIWKGGPTIVVNVGTLTVWEKGGGSIVACDFTNGGAYVFSKSLSVTPL